MTALSIAAHRATTRAMERAAGRVAEPAAAETPLAQRLADGVVGALTDEVTLTPKPGLVDLRGRGAHRDLDWALMCHSAWALHPSFVAMAEAGQRHTDPQVLRDAIGHLGRLGEAVMMRATDGVNTHRGAIWAMGLMVAAAACDPESCAPAAVAARAGALARLDDRAAPATTGNKGELACRRYGVGGARAQAAADFPHVIEVALPELRRSRAAGNSEDSARLNALLAVMSRLDDTCVLARGGEAALRELQAGALRVLAVGGVGSAFGRRALQALDARLLTLHVSPGGAADLLAATLFLDRIESELQPQSKGNLHGKTRV